MVMRVGVWLGGVAFAMALAGAAQAADTATDDSGWALYYFRCLDTHHRAILVSKIGTPTFALDGPTAMPAALKIFARAAAKQTKHACDTKTVYLRGPFTSPVTAQNDYDADMKMMQDKHPHLPLKTFAIPVGPDAVAVSVPSHKKITQARVSQ